MAIIYMFVILFGAIAVMSFVKVLNLGSGSTSFIIILLFLLFIFLLAWIQPKERTTKEDTNE